MQKLLPTFAHNISQTRARTKLILYKKLSICV